MKTILLISPYWKEEHRWMVSSVKLAELWQRIGYKVVVLCMGKGKEISGQRSAVSIERVSNTLEIHRVPDFFLPDPWNYGIAFGFGGHALQLARELKPDVIVVNKVLFWSSISLIQLHFVGYPVLLLTDALVGITWWPRSFIAKACAALYAWTLGWVILLLATKVVFFHPQPPKILKKLCIQDKSTVIPTGIDPAPYRSGNTSLINPVRVTYVGRLESVKGVDDFCAAAYRIKKKYPEVRVSIVGWYTENHPLVEQYKRHFEFTGLRHDIPAVLAETDVFVMPSHAEGLSNAVMEAMSAGCACIATDVGGNPFLIQNGVSGLLFPPRDQAALEAHLERLVRDPHKRLALGKAARARVDDVFSWEKVGKKYEELFSSWKNETR